jgi:DNA-binding PadR family transcriptional regulator
MEMSIADVLGGREDCMQHHLPDPQAFLPLTPASFQILLTLVGTELHGYGIMREVTRTTHGQMHLGSGTLYRSIRQLLDAHLITEVDERVDPTLNDERRRYYRLTVLGEQVVRAESLRLAAIVEQARTKHLLPEGGAVEGTR